MIRHIVMYNFKNPSSDNQNLVEKFRTDLLELKNILDGVIEIDVCIGKLKTCQRDIILNSLFKDEQSLTVYQNHPKHLEVVDFVRQNFTDRVCFDYEE